MKIMKKDLNEVAAVAKRMVDKKTGRLHFYTDGSGTLRVTAETEGGIFLFFRTMPSMDSELFSFETNPHTLTPFLKGANEEMNWKLGDTHMVLNGTKEAQAITHTETPRGQKWETFPLVPLQRPEQLINVLKEAEAVLKENPDPLLQFVKVTPEKALVIEPRQSRLYRMAETFPFAGGYLDKHAVGVLARTLKGDTLCGYADDHVIWKNKDNWLVCPLHRNIPFPNFRKLHTEENEYTFRIEAETVQNILKSYKKEVTEIEVRFEKSGQRLDLIIDPRTEGLEPSRIEQVKGRGAFKKTVFEAKLLKSLFAAYSGPIWVRQRKTRNLRGEQVAVWRVYTPEKSIIAVPIDEPDYEEIDRAFESGTIHILAAEEEKKRHTQ